MFSWQEGRRKPDIEMYAAVVGRLGVPEKDCWYVGDGGSRELWEADRAGTRPVLITNAGHPRVAGVRDSPDQFRPREVIGDITVLLDLVLDSDPARSRR
ncbi:HAD hydrolase-like protein [Actinoplanes sp. TFC3]|uniref:HAD hydrolase-like protein n=1 Tax=Actinoplanes sp. TFC3 TaxID=1710355 RepID=UPI00082E5D0A|nr:HAD hydrolase-like protein [Actinoplanes sp. TFC3]